MSAHKGSPEAQAALSALATALHMGPATLRSILESSLNSVHAGVGPAAALRTTCASFGYEYDTDAFEGLMQAFRQVFSELAARSDVDVDVPRIVVTAPAKSAAETVNPYDTKRTPSLLLAQNVAPQAYLNGPALLYHNGIPSSPSFYHHRDYYQQYLLPEYDTVPGFWSADSGFAFDTIPQPLVVGLGQGGQTHAGLSELMQGYQGFYNAPPLRDTNWSMGRYADSMEEWRDGSGER
ncbi:hypothetical protein NX059_002485 [Plenodomus lindquistii]|nr:hypothetical protein NX059_002485 [Plenodomus lindquistii]